MKIKNGFVLEQVGEHHLAVATGALADEFHALVRLNGTGAFLWNCLAASEQTEDELVAALVRQYDVPSDVARRDVAAFLETLRKNGILA